MKRKCLPARWKSMLVLPNIPINEIGRLVSAIEDLGEMDNTLFLYVVGDNGASAEGTMNGMYNEMTYFNGVPETVAGYAEAL